MATKQNYFFREIPATLLLSWNIETHKYEFSTVREVFFEMHHFYDTPFIHQDNFGFLMKNMPIEEAKVLLLKFAKEHIDSCYHLYRKKQGGLLALEDTLSKETGSGGDQPASGSERRER